MIRLALKVQKNCFTRNDNETRVLINQDNGEICITGMAEDSFWDRKLYSKLKRDSAAKKSRQQTHEEEKIKKLFLCNKIPPNF